MLLPRRTLRLCVSLIAFALTAVAQNPLRTAPIRFAAHPALAVTLSAAAPAPNLCAYSSAPDGTAAPLSIAQKLCLTLPSNGAAPEITNTIAAPLRTGAAAQFFFAEDAANLTIDVIAANTATSPNLTVVSRVPIAAAGPIALTDINNDSNTDILLNNPLTGNLSLYAGNGDGTFQPAVALLPATHVQSFLIQDIDRDNIPDLLAETTTGNIEIHRGTGDSTAPFALESSGSTTTSLQNAASTRLLAVVDLNHDGTPDLLVAIIAGPAILLGERDSSDAATVQFTALTALPGTPQQQKLGPIVVADFDRDGNQDIAAVFQNAASDLAQQAAPASLYVWYGNGDGTFTEPVVTPLDRNFTLATAAAISNTTLPELILSDGSAVAFLANLGNREFAAPASYLTGQRINALASADANTGTLLIAGADASLTEQTSTRPRATGSSPTQTVLDLCVGPTQNCPSDGLVNPPYVPTLTMFWGQTFNGTTIASTFDGSALDPASFITVTDSFNGAAPVTLCTLSIAYGSTCPPSIGLTVGTNVGTHVFTATYSGDATHAPSTSPSVTITVQPDTTTGTLTTSASPTGTGRPATFTATFTGNFAAPDGTVTFLNGSTVLGTATLVPSNTSVTSAPTPSTATFTTTSLAAGTYTITASDAGDTNFQSASATVQQIISAPTQSSSQLTSSLNPSASGQSVIFTDTVTASGVTPAGTVTFTSGAATLGTVTLSTAGIATLTTSSLPAGSNTITATYSGSSILTASTATLIQNVNALPPAGSINFSITVTPSSVSLGVGSAATLTVTVTPLTSFSAPITLSCGNLPYETACTFASQTIPAGGGSTTLLLSAMAPHSCDSNAPYFVAGASGPAGLPRSALPGIVVAMGFFGFGAKRRWLRMIAAFAAIAVTLQLTGCGNCTDLGTRPATYTIRVAGTAAANSETESTTIPVNVHL